MINYPEPDASGAYDERYHQKGAIWEDRDNGYWLPLSHCDRWEGGTLLYAKWDSFGRDAAEYRPVMLLTGDPEQDYAELCSVFGVRDDYSSQTIGVLGDLDDDDVVWLTLKYLGDEGVSVYLTLSEDMHIAGHGTPPELPLLQHNINCVQHTLDEMREARQ